MNNNLQIIPYRSTPNTPPGCSSPINFDEASSRPLTPFLNEKALHVFRHAQFTITRFTSLKNRVSTKEGCQEIILRTDVLVNQIRVKYESRQFEELKTLTTQLEKEILSLQLLALRGEKKDDMAVIQERWTKVKESYSLLAGQLNKVKEAFGLDEQLVNRYGVQFLQAIARLFQQLKVSQVSDKMAVFTILMELNANLSDLKKRQIGYITSLKEEIAPPPKDLDSSLTAISNYQKEQETAPEKLKRLRKELKELIDLHGNWAENDECKTENERELYLTEFKRRMQEEAGFKEEQIKPFIELMREQLDKKKALVKQDIDDLYRQGQYEFFLHDVEFVFFDMTEVQAGVIGLKQDILKCERLLEPSDQVQKAYSTVQKSKSLQFSDPAVYRQKIHMIENFTDSVDRIDYLLKELNSICRLF